MLSNIYFDTVTAYITKSSNAQPFINDYFGNIPFVVLLLLRLGAVETTLVLKNRQLSNSVIGT